MTAAPAPLVDHPSHFVAVGASGEGLSDLRDLLHALPGDLAAAVLVAFHRPSDQISHLREVLQRRSALPVVIPQEADRFRAGVCYIGEPAAHLSLAVRSRVHLIAGARDLYRNRTVDLLFASVAEHARSRAIGVVLRGSLSDGSKGLAAIHFAVASPWCSAPAVKRHQACRGTPQTMTGRLTSPARSRRSLSRSPGFQRR